MAATQLRFVPDIRLAGRRPLRTASRYIVFATAIALLAACAGDSVSPDRTTADAKHKNGGTTPPPPPPPTTNPPPPIPVSGNPIAGASFWINPNSNAKKTADSWRASRPADAAQMDKIAMGSQAQWFGGWSGDIFTAVTNAVNTVTAAGAVPVFVAYNIPQRDCGGLSGGGGVPARRCERRRRAEHERRDDRCRACRATGPNVLHGSSQSRGRAQDPCSSAERQAGTRATSRSIIERTVPVAYAPAS